LTAWQCGWGDHGTGVARLGWLAWRYGGGGDKNEAPQVWVGGAPSGCVVPGRRSPGFLALCRRPPGMGSSNW